MTIRVDWHTSCNLTGTAVAYLSTPLVLPTALALYYREPVVAFLVTIALTLAVGGSLRQLERRAMGVREAFLTVSLS